MVVYFDWQTGASACHMLVEVKFYGILSSFSITNRNKTGLQPVSRPVAIPSRKKVLNIGEVQVARISEMDDRQSGPCMLCCMVKGEEPFFVCILDSFACFCHLFLYFDGKRC